MTGVEVIDGTRIDYKMALITREEAIARIRSVADVTEVGAADLLDHPDTAAHRYHAAFSSLPAVAGEPFTGSVGD